MNITGTTFSIYGIISTDDILPAVYKHKFVAPEEFGQFIFSNLITDFNERLPEEAILVGNSIFGVGSSREQAVTGMKSRGIKAIIAPEFGRIFYRNCWNNGLPAIVLKDLRLADETPLSIDLENGIVETPGKSFNFTPPSQMQLDLVRHGNLISMYLEQL